MHDSYRAILTGALPALPIRSFAYAGEGEDHIAFEVDEALIFRFDKGRDRAALEREVRVLRYVNAFAPLPTPSPVYVGLAEGFIGYRKLPGTPLLGVTGATDQRGWPDFAARIGGLLRALNRAPIGPLADVLDEDIAIPAELLAEARATFSTVRPLIPERHREPIGTFLAADPPDSPFTPVFAHNDLGIEHILVDVAARQVTGIIDWGDAALADPAYDLGKLYRDLGPGMLDAILDAYDAGDEHDALRRRAIFYGRCGVFEDLAYGIETERDEYIAKSVAALPWLFP